MKQLQQAIRLKLDAPCDTPEDQLTHDRLASYDRLVGTGHTPTCATLQVWAGNECVCK